MPRKKPKPVAEEAPVIHIVYIGAVAINIHKYKYLENDTIISFSRKLYSKHKIGLVYKVYSLGNGSYRLIKDELEPVSQWINTRDIVEWIRTDMLVRTEKKRIAERGKVLKFARECIQPLVPLYKRAGYYDKNQILQALVEELEKI